METYNELVKYGTTGISLALVGLIALLVKLAREDRKDFKEVIINHLTHNTEVQEKQTEIMNRLANVIEMLDRKLNNKR